MTITLRNPFPEDNYDLSKKTPTFSINGYKLYLTCYACPEQYDVLDKNDNMVGYFRLRHGCFTAKSPDVGGKLVYVAYPDGDGIFTEGERTPELTKAIEALHQQLLQTKE